MSWAAEVDASGLVLRVIVATPEWAATNLGGTWVACEKYSSTQTYPGPGYGHSAASPAKFAPVAPPGLEKAPENPEDAIPPGTLFWDKGQIVSVETIAQRRGVLTAAEAQAAIPVRPTGGRP